LARLPIGDGFTSTLSIASKKQRSRDDQPLHPPRTTIHSVPGIISIRSDAGYASDAHIIVGALIAR
jgi:hypothetical protein